VDVSPTALPEVKLVTLDAHPDERGFFVERYREERFASLGLPTQWPQDNHSRSRRGVLRGLHYQLTKPQGKLVACLHGAIFDVAVDVRVGSPSFGKWVGVELTGDVAQLLWIPPGFAHGFCALSDVADVTYKCTSVYVAADERGVAWNDPEMAIRWPVEDPVMSRRDRELPRLADAELPRFAAAAVTR
jgi:dTDP-4-dehydrorhamnose 3,5-epimerase